MKSVRIKYIILFMFALLFANLLSINVSRVSAEEETIDLSNAYRGEIRDYWALVNYGDDFVGSDTVTIFLDPEAISNPDIYYIQINEFDRYGDIHTTFYKRGVDSSFASRFTYAFVNSGYGERKLTMFLLEDLSNDPTDIIERINIDRLQRVKTIEELDCDDLLIVKEVTEMTSSPYNVYVSIKDNPQDYLLKSLTYTYVHRNNDGTTETIVGNAIYDADNYRFYFAVSENATYYMELEDHFGYTINTYPTHPLVIDNFYPDVINIVVEYDHSLTNNDVLYIDVAVYDGEGVKFHNNLIDYIEVKDSEGNVIADDIKNIGFFSVSENGLYTIHCVMMSGEEEYLTINITNIDREAPIVVVSDLITISSSDVAPELRPNYVFDPLAQVIATDNASLGEKLVVSATYHFPNLGESTCQIYDPLPHNVYEYLYGVNDVCVEYSVSDEAGNIRLAYTRITVIDNTKPTVTSTESSIILQIGDRIPDTDELTDKFGLRVADNSKLYDDDNLRVLTIDGDLSGLNLEELGVYTVYITATDESNNVSDRLPLTVIVTERILVVEPVPNQYIVYGEPMIDIAYTCNGNPCRDEILQADWGKLTGELYITSGAKYAGNYPIFSSIAINSNKYTIKLGRLGDFVIKQRTFKIIAHSVSIDYKDAEPALTWYMDTSVCNPDLSTKYTSIDETNYSCTFVNGDAFTRSVTYVGYDDVNGVELYTGGIAREPGDTVKYDANGVVTYYKIHLGTLSVDEVSSGGKVNYYLDFHGLYNGTLLKERYVDWDGVEHQAGARFYIIPKYVEITIKDVVKIYGEADPNTVYDDDYANAKRVETGDTTSNYQYEFSCFAYKEPIKSMTTQACLDEVVVSITREKGENVGRYKITGSYANLNYDVRFNEEFESRPVNPAYLNIVTRTISVRVVGTNNDGKYTIFYEDPLPYVELENVPNQPSYQGLANGNYLDINDGTVISFADVVYHGDHPVKYLDSNGNVMDVVIGGYEEYVTGVGTFRIVRDDFTIHDKDGQDVLANYNLIFEEGILTVLARQIYIKVIEGLTKIYGESDPTFTEEYLKGKYGDTTTFLLDGNNKFVLQIINTLDNNEIVDDDDYEPFDKDLLKYYLVRDRMRLGQSVEDVHPGEMVGSYRVLEEYFANASNYIIDIYQEYYFEITPREISLRISDNTIEFNYDNLVPKFTYSFSNTAFGDSLIGQPSVAAHDGTYRNNGFYTVSRGEITAISGAPVISRLDGYWCINGMQTIVAVDTIPDFDATLLKIIDNEYHIIDLKNKTTINTLVTAIEVNVMWNYTFDEQVGVLSVTPRNVIVVADDSASKQYGDSNDGIVFTYSVKHYPDLGVEAILDPSDFTGELSREEGEKPGLYEITQGTLAPATKGYTSNFNIVAFESNRYFEITKRTLTIRLAAAEWGTLEDGTQQYVVEIYYGDSLEFLFDGGYIYVEGSEAYQKDLYTEESVNGELQDILIYDKIVGTFVFDPENPVNVGEYHIRRGTYRIVRVMNQDVDVTDYYNFDFVDVVLRINKKEIKITPNEGQSKIYGESDHTGNFAGCGIGFTFNYSRITYSDFSGCLRREPITLPDGTTTREDKGEYTISLGDLRINDNYELRLVGNVKFVINPRVITVTARVLGDNVVKSPGGNVYTMVYGNEYSITYEVTGHGVADNDELGIHDVILNDVFITPEVDPNQLIPVGNYGVNTALISVTNIRNYEIIRVNAQFAVTKRKLTVLPDNLSKVYGVLEDPELTFTVLEGNYTPISGSLSRVSGQSARSYPIEKGTLDFGENYDVTILEAYFTILPRKVEVNAVPGGKVYGTLLGEGEEVYAYTYSVEDNFDLDVPFSGELMRENPTTHDVGTYAILQHTLALSPNYQIIYTPADYTIYFVEINDINIRLLRGAQYQVLYEEEEVAVFAEFNLGGDPKYLKDVVWTITKTGNFDISYHRDVNNIITFTPSGSSGIYTIRASYNGLSDEFIVSVNPSNVSTIYINLAPGSESTHILGKENPVTYTATVHLIDNNRDEDYYVEWYAGGNLMCKTELSNYNPCTFVPDLPIGVHDVYAKVTNVVSESLHLTIKDNEVPKITLKDQDVIYYIEAHQNNTENSNVFDPNEGLIQAWDDVDGDITNKVIIKGMDELDYYTVGTYHILYEVMDSHNHLASNYRTIIVQDTVAPVVNLNEPSLTEYYLEYGEPYVEYGASAFDIYDNYHEKPVIVYTNSTNLDLSKTGTYTIIYMAADSNGNVGVAMRLVHVKDSVPPTIELIGDAEMYVEYKETFRDPGAWFDDNYDGRFKIYPSRIVLKREGSDVEEDVDTIDTSILGVYRLTYYQPDSNNNYPEAAATRNVKVGDSRPPVITLLGDNPYILRYGQKYIEPGYRVIDNYDGDITNRTDLVSVKVVIGDTLGTYYAYYKAYDTHGNESEEIKRTIIVLDLVSPVINFTDKCPQYMTVEAITGRYDTECDLPETGYYVEDDYLPDINEIQNWVVVQGSVDVNLIGVYEIHYNVSDRSGNVSETLIRYVSVVDTTPPEVTLEPNEEGLYDFYVEVFSQFRDPGCTATDAYDNHHGIEIQIEVYHNVNVNKLNTYTVTYIATDSSGNESVPVYREITVRDTVPPVVTLIGDETITLERGTRYVEYKATASDNYDGMIEIDDIVIEGKPTGMEIGTFIVTYSATDSSGNVGYATRTVIVQDTIAPIVNGVQHGRYYRTPLYIYYYPLTGTNEILTGYLNNELISSGWYVSKEGKYHLEVSDDAGNKTVIDFTIDMTAPVLYGVKDGEYVNHPVTIYSDDELQRITYRINNGGFVAIDEETAYFDVEGQYWVYGTDKAGNIGNVISFVIDLTPPTYYLQGVENKGITNTDVVLSTEPGVVVSVNNEYIPTNYTFYDNGYYQVTIRDLAGNDVFIQFVINKNPTVTIDGKSVSFISQNNAIDKLIIRADANYPKGVGFIYAKPLLGGGFEYISGNLFSDEEYNKLINGEDLTFDVPEVEDKEMVVAFVVTLDELNKFTTQTVEGDDDSAIKYAFFAVALAGLLAGGFYFFVVTKRKKEEEEEEEVIEEEDIYF